MFHFSLSEKDGWFFTDTFNAYQRVNRDVYCYITRKVGFYCLQLYERGTTGFCLLEARSKNKLEDLFTLGEEWLDRFKDWDAVALQKNHYYIGQQDWKDKCWI